MAERFKAEPKPAGDYFSGAKTELELIPSGSRLLDCALGGGWVLGRIANIVGDTATTKTLLAMEAIANFVRTYNEPADYREAEAAFDYSYANALGIPLSMVNFGKGVGSNEQLLMETVEDLFEDLERKLARLEKSGKPGLYIVDSLDALSDRGELDNAIDKGSFGAAKAKMLSQLFRRLVRRIEKTRMCLIIISQVRDNIGVTFGRKTTRSGGHALDFYSSQIAYLAKIKTLTETIKGVTRPVGVQIKVKIDKNKIGLPFRECEFPVRFAYGIDDLKANLDWLKEVNRLPPDLKSLASYERLGDEDYFVAVAHVGGIVERNWREIDEGFMPSRRKY